MWSCYSKPGGIAVKIPFYRFKKCIENYFQIKHTLNLNNNITKIHAGKVKYKKYYFDTSWYDDIEKQTPLAFFKHTSYKNENEYRVIIELNDTNSVETEKHQKPFDPLLMKYFEIILHPSATHEDMSIIKSKTEYPETLNISFSELTFK